MLVLSGELSCCWDSLLKLTLVWRPGLLLLLLLLAWHRKEPQQLLIKRLFAALVSFFGP
jgi:hypothetical protein